MVALSPLFRNSIAAGYAPPLGVRSTLVSLRMCHPLYDALLVRHFHDSLFQCDRLSGLSLNQRRNAECADRAEAYPENLGHGRFRPERVYGDTGILQSCLNAAVRHITRI